jgi:hypothetical protein
MADPLQIRPSGYPRPADHPPQAGAAQPNAGGVALPQGQPETAFRQLPAGPLRQLDGAVRLPRSGAGVQDRGRPGRRHDGLQPVRFLRRGQRGAWPFDYPEDCPTIWSSTGLPNPPARGCRRFSIASRASDRTVDFVVGLNARLCQRDRLRHPHGAGRADAGGNAGDRQGLVPRHQLAAGAGAAASGFAARFVSGYLIQLKPDL